MDYKKELIKIDKEAIDAVRDDLYWLCKDPKDTYHLRKVILRGSKKELKNIVSDYWSTLLKINKLQERLGYLLEDDDQLELPKGGE